MMRLGNKKNVLIVLSVMVVFWPLGALLSYLYLALCGVIKSVKQKGLESRFILFIPFVVIATMISMYKGNFITEFDFLSKLLLFAISPFVLTTLKKQDTLVAVKCFVLAMVVADIYSLGHLVYYFYNSKYEFTTSNFGHLNEALAFERPYIGFKNSVAFIITMFSMNINRRQLTHVLILVILFGYTILISARLAMGVMIVSILFYIVSEIKSKKVIFLSLGILILFLGITIWSLPSLKERFGNLSKDPRVLIWSSAWEISSTKDFSPLAGNKSIGKEEIVNITTTGIVSHMKIKLWKDFYADKMFNTHNQFLFLYLYGGGLLLFSFLIPFILLVIESIRNNLMYSVLLISVMAFLVLENVLERELGIIFIGGILSYIISFDKNCRIK